MFSTTGFVTEERSQSNKLIDSLIIVLPLIFLGLLLLGDSELPSEMIFYFRVFFNLLGPLLAFLTYLFLGLKFIRIEIDKKEVKQQLAFILTLSVLGIFFAITLNTRNLLLVSALYSIGIFSQETSLYLMFAIMGPLIEEFVKIFPALVMAKHVQIDKQGQNRYIKEPTAFLFFALIGGGIFNLLETYWYSWSVGSLEQITDPSNWYFVSLQIIIRSTNPLHITSALIASLGIILSLRNSTENKLSKTNSGPFLSYFLAAVVFHGLWNASTVQGESQPQYLMLPLTNWILLGISLIGFIAILMNYGNIVVSSCNQCGNWHNPEVFHHELNFLQQMNTTSEDKLQYKCKSCGSQKPGRKCPTCNSSEVYACSNCKYPLPIYAFECWKCQNQITPIYDKLTTVEPEPFNQFSMRIYALFALMYIGQLLVLLSNFSQSEEISNLPNQLILFVVISSALMLGLYLNLTDNFRQWGIIISRYLFGLILLLLAVLFMIVLVIFITTELYLPSLLIVLAIGLFGYFSYRVLMVNTIFVRSIN